jgi:hypothetical protein
MASTLFDAAYKLAVSLGVAVEGTCTGTGTTATIVDANRNEADDAWNSGTAFILYDAGGAGAAPQGEWSVISDFVYSTHTITVSPVLTVATATSDRYAVAKKRYDRGLMIQQINAALTKMGPMPVTDKTTITLASGQSEYTLPVNANYDLRQVWIQGLNDSDDNQWYEYHSWRIEKAATGTGSLLIMTGGIESGMDVKLVYLGLHPTLNVASDKIAEGIYIDRLVANAKVGCLEWRFAKTNDQVVANLLQQALQERDRLDAKYPIVYPRKQAHLLTNWNTNRSHYDRREVG